MNKIIFASFTLTLLRTVCSQTACSVSLPQRVPCGNVVASQTRL